MLGRLGLRRAANTPNSTSLGTVPNAATNLAPRSLFASTSAPDDEARVVDTHRQRAAHDDLAGKAARLLQHVPDPGPMDGEQQDVGAACGLARRARPGTPFRLARQPLELPRAARVAEHHVVPGAREQRAELPSHQAGTQDADAHPRDQALDPATAYSLWTRPLGYERVATCVSRMSCGRRPNNEMPAPIRTGTRVMTSRSMRPALRNPWIV